jgi:hypothetical protein
VVAGQWRIRQGGETRGRLNTELVTALCDDRLTGKQLTNTAVNRPGESGDFLV